ncbi:DUF2569 domain-containing protein [Mesorhizobium sp. BAC0120]|uniref:DUF2569 domain-containing protein n=1 Tax=Mesorhizobium sp. BAC0120 TaxID=3090670 RepID=UPI00298D12B1|nr:DUF2569 domain-containing protein [Mesorhizobium sp. BAC0120]MDW6025029.1 DUF2569 domain-containing protein [Mesorhizobium sp. BAC0120]
MEETQTDDPSDGPAGLGGWLILPLLGLFLVPLTALTRLAKDTAHISELWPLLTAAQAAFTVAELAVHVTLFFAAPIALLYFMFKRWEIFPGWYMIWWAAIPVTLIAFALVGYATFPEAEAHAFDEETMRAIIGSVIGAAIWIPYMMQSERVMNTFVR